MVAGSRCQWVFGDCDWVGVNWMCESSQSSSRWWFQFSIFLYFHPYLTNIFQMGWNHQLVFPWWSWCIWPGFKVWGRGLIANVLKSEEDRSTARMLQVNVALPNGHAELLSLLPSCTVQDLRTAAQQALGKNWLRLITSENRVLVNPEETLEEAEIEDGECLTALVLPPQLAATASAFALWCHGYSGIVTWGDARKGGDRSAVQDKLKGVQQVQGTDGAFAALLADGSVVTWGDAGYGGDSSAVQDQLRGVQHIQATRFTYAFAALLADGSVVTWGDPESGFDSPEVRDQLRGVQQIQDTHEAYAAILADGSVFTWGYDPRIRTRATSEVLDQLRGVQQIQRTDCAFAVILADGSVVAGGNALEGGDISAVQDQLRGVQQIQATREAFAALLADGSVVTWGYAAYGGDSSAVQDQLRGVQQIQATCEAFAALLADGSVVTWGDALRGGDSSAVQDQVKGVQQIQATCEAFAALLADGSVFTWGYNPRIHTSESSEVLDELRGVQHTFCLYICCASGRWIRRHLGCCRLWRWQLGSSRWAQGCAADCGRRFCICCASCRWICRYLGRSSLRWWQFGSSRSTQVCLVQLCMSNGKAWAVA